MQQNEQHLIRDLFAKLRAVEGQERDPEAERLIAEEMRRTPNAAYAMAQTIIVQNAALERAQAQLEGRDDRFASERAPGAMGAPPLGRSGTVPSFGSQPALGAQARGQQGGGFLANAGQVALGVAGGMLIGEAAKSIFGGGEAQAATPAAEAAPDNALADNAGADDIGSAGDDAAAVGGDEGGGGLFGWLFGGGGSDDASADDGYDLADGGWDGGDFGE